MIVLRPERKQFLQEAATSYQKQFWEDEAAQTYVAGRGITKEAALQFGLGVVREPVQGHETFVGRLTFPYYTSTGISTIRFRFLGDHKPSGATKFIALTGDTSRLYNITSAISESKVYVCEGETDTIAASMAGLTAVGIPGATSWKPPFARVLRNREVVVLADNDDGGEGRKFAEQVVSEVDQGDIILMPRGHDVSSFVQAYGLAALREKVGA